MIQKHLFKKIIKAKNVITLNAIHIIRDKMIFIIQ